MEDHLDIPLIYMLQSCQHYSDDQSYGIDHRSNLAMLHRAYFAIYGILRLAISSYLIYRFRIWGNTPGRCFVVPHVLPHIDVRVPLIFGTALRIAWDRSMTMISARALIIGIFVQRKAWPSSPLGDLLGSEQEFPSDLKGSLTFWGAISFLVPFIWNASWTLTIVVMNQGHVLGDE